MKRYYLVCETCPSIVEMEIPKEVAMFLHSHNLQVRLESREDEPKVKTLQIYKGTR